MKKILVIKGESKYGVLRRATDHIVEGFIDKGYDVDLLDLDKTVDFERMKQDIYKEYSFIFSCQAICFNVLSKSKNDTLLNRLSSPYIGWIFDDVMMHMDRVKNAKYDHVSLMSIDEASIDTVKLMYPDTKNIFFLPHGGFETPVKQTKKDIDVLFPGNFTREIQLSELQCINPVEKKIAEEIVELLDATPVISPRTALYRVLEMYDIEITSDILLAFTNVLMFLNRMIHANWRRKMLLSLLDANINVLVVGDGYDELFDKYPSNLRYAGGLDVDEMMTYMSRTKVVINPLYPVLERGFHERIFSAMLARAVVFTPVSDFLYEQLGDRVNYISLNNLQDMNERVIKAIDEYETEYVDNLESNFEYALCNHSWRERGHQIVDMFESGKIVSRRS